jgi:hypothetical protein
MIEISEVAKGKIKEVLGNYPGKYVRVFSEGVG